MGLEYQSKLNQLLISGRKNGLYFSDWLKKNGYSDQLTRRYRQSGWLSMLDKGVMYRSGDALSSFAALSCYNEQLSKEVRVAAHSALELFGFNHYVPMGKPILMVACPNSSVPKWMLSNRFDRTIKPFSTKMIDEPQTSIVQADGVDVLISAPEQAFMECLLLAPRQYDYMDLYYIMEQLTSLRAEVVQILLENVKNLRVKRLFLYMAEKAGHYWFDMLNRDKINIGTSKQQLANNGTYISKYKITIPKELVEYE
ncbi:MAG: type IV toxin-antitoxin system AbiEi family antitoxin [Bacteroidales bacterium]|nr:type IV toxin-antitoxin system AbiEi family antitoxin [Bacteroidales bacterium]